MEDENKNTNPEDEKQENLNEEAKEEAKEEVAEEIVASAVVEEAIEEDEEDYEKPTVKSISMKWGLYVGLVFIAWGIIMQVAGLVGDETMGYVSYIFLIGGMYMAHKEFKDNGDGYMSYSQGLGIGTLTTLISGVISTVFTYIYVKFIDDSMMGIIKDKQIEAMEEQGLSDAEIDQAMGFSAPFLTPEVMFPIALLATVFFGFIIALIVSAITKNTDPSLDA